MKKYIFTFLGIINVGLGILGIFLPLLPTTPFLLLAAYLFLKSSTKHYEWLMNHKVFGDYLRNYKQHKAIPIKTKIFSLSFLWLTILSSIYFVDIIYVRLGLLFIAVAVSVHIARFKTLNKE